jgi:hypothetical protein
MHGYWQVTEGGYNDNGIDPESTVSGRDPVVSSRFLGAPGMTVISWRPLNSRGD